MKNCKFKIVATGDEFSSYADLVLYLLDKLSAKDLEGITDIVFSKIKRQEELVEKIKLVLLENSEFKKNASTLLDGEQLFTNGMHILEFFDTDYFNINGRTILTPYNENDYKKTKIQQLIEELNISEEDAIKLVEEQFENQDKLIEDSAWIHGIVNTNYYMTDDASLFINAVKEVPDRLNNLPLLASLLSLLKHIYITEKGRYSDSLAIKNIILKSKLKGIDKELFGKIDWLFVGLDGKLHLYLFKVTGENPKEWIKVKRDKYKYLLAFLKLMLANNGIDTTDIDLNLIPILLTYNQNYSAILRVLVYPAESISTRKSDPRYAMHKYDRDAAYFITSNFVPYHISSAPILRAIDVVDHIFPDLNLKSTGFDMSALEWIKYAPNIDPTNSEPLVVTRVDEIDHAYEVFINGKKFNIKSGKDKIINRELINLVSEHIKELDSHKTYSLQRVKDAINNSFDKGFMTFALVNGLKGISTSLENLFGKYLMDYTTNEETKERTYKWEMLDDLIDANIILFRNTENGTIDVVTLTAFDINARAQLRRGKNILGSYKTDGENPGMEANYGNIEAVKTMELLNEIIALLGDVLFGTLSVISSINKAPYTLFNIGEFNKNHFLEIVKIVNEENPDLKILNNFIHANFTDAVEDILNEYNRIIENKPKTYRVIYSLHGFEELYDSEDRVLQLLALDSILKSILNEGYGFSDPVVLERTLNTSQDSVKRNMALLYNLVTKAYLSIKGETPTRQTSFNKINAHFFTAPTVNDPNILIVVNNIQVAHDTIASEFLDLYEDHIRKPFDTFYKEIGYTDLQNIVIGNLAQQFSNFYEMDGDTNLLVFKNPYESNTITGLKPYELKLLKEVLFRIAWINSNGNFKFKSPNDPGLPEYIEKNKDYLWVPLIRASRATRRLSGKAVVAGMKNFWNKVKNASSYFDEFVLNMMEEERDLMGSGDIYLMHLHNPFELSVRSSGKSMSETIKSRLELIAKYGPEYFETNIENILIEFLGKHISTTQYNKVLYGTKALLWLLHVTGNMNGNKEVVEKEKKWIEDYIKVNVFNTSVMSPTELKIVGVIYPIKRIVSHLILAGNVVSALRDVINGTLENFIRSVIKLNTDISPKDVLNAYKYVHTHSTSNAMAVNLLSKLCLKYRISNTDVGRITERAKSGRNGIFNIENWMYGTLRSPDFLNRMTLFVARCMHDGVWEAYSLNKEGKLIYDWTKDKRFRAYKYGVVGSKEYKEAKALYLSKIREYNKEHPDNPINPEDGLPSPYTNTEINVIKGLADNIYGSYDISKRNMAENESYGVLFGTFTTWMNGIVNTYFMPAQKNKTSKLKRLQEVDELGRKLFWDEYGNITNKDTGMPIWEDVPAPVQGIFPMLREAICIALDSEKGGINAAMAYLKGNEVMRANIYKLQSDALMWLLYWILFNLAITPAYKEHKKTMHNNPVLVNLLTEVLYKSTSRAYDSFKGPINVLLFFGENLNPPFYSTPVEIVKDAAAAAMGEKSWRYLLLDNTGLTRSFRDTATAYLKD